MNLCHIMLLVKGCTVKVWGEYVSVVCRILSLASKTKYKEAEEFKISFI